MCRYIPDFPVSRWLSRIKSRCRHDQQVGFDVLGKLRDFMGTLAESNVDIAGYVFFVEKAAPLGQQLLALLLKRLEKIAFGGNLYQPRIGVNDVEQHDSTHCPVHQIGCHGKGFFVIGFGVHRQ
ncbi:MAG: hypothetical protein KatS3mg105_4398 [Gemmatales bacterium]|nr:MAG: hypothetical protein KatS3mg105_4398 [Gemmatales bacterium]